jgi:UDP-2,3-diacylglucosamine pyrophosphatase LpxH
MNIVKTHKDVPIVVVGDLHGEWDVINNQVKKNKIEDIVIFCAGDFGVGFGYNNPRNPIKEKKRIIILNNFLKKRNIFLYVVRGNHDNPLFFDGKHNFENVFFMQDYDVVEVGEHKILGIGGAISLDKNPNCNIRDYRGKHWGGRTEGKDWWSDEIFLYNKEKINQLFDIDVVITHTSPDFTHPPIVRENIKRLLESDKNLKNELIEERRLLTMAYNNIKKNNIIKFWFYGHFHEKNVQKFESTKFVLLDVNDFLEIKF